MSKNNLPGEAFSDRENAETYEQLDLSELIYGMPMGEADFMLNEAQEIQYNETCQECRQDCKQSFRCQVVECPKFRVRRSRILSLSFSVLKHTVKEYFHFCHKPHIT